MKKKNLKKSFNKNQRSFFFEDYLSTNQNFKSDKKSSVSEDRIYLLFFCFLSLIFIFSIKIIYISLQESNFNTIKNSNINFKPLRNDIVDRNGILLSRNILTYHAAIKPNLIKDKKKFVVKIKLAFPETNSEELVKNLNTKKYFYLKKRLTYKQKLKLWKLGERGIIFEPFQTRIYPHADLYSHIIGQTDYDNYGISGVENYYNNYLKNNKKDNKPLVLSLDTNIQFLVKKQLEKAMKTFEARGAAALVLDSSNGEVFSLVSLPDFNINQRIDVKKEEYMNKITKGVFELGSIFKTFTVAIALEEKIVNSKSIITDISKKVKCSVHEISDVRDFPQTMTVEDILIQSSNIGTINIAKKIGEEKYKSFLKKINILESPRFELDELGTPLPFSWNKCKLETISFGHGITTTPLQAAAAYASLLNGGTLVVPTLKKDKNKYFEKQRVISKTTSKEINKILRKVVTHEKGTASLANIHGYNVSGKTGTSQYYDNKNKNINTFISSFSISKNNYILLVMLDDPQIAKELIYNYRGNKIKASRNEAGWNAVYVAGKIIEKIGPILAINNKEISNKHVVKKIN